jgi:hypothetical protein
MLVSNYKWHTISEDELGDEPTFHTRTIFDNYLTAFNRSVLLSVLLRVAATRSAPENRNECLSICILVIKLKIKIKIKIRIKIISCRA